MKIVAGLGSIDDYITLVKAGADEVFCGYVPYEWNKQYKNLFPLNRREVLYYNVQINSLSEMKILKKMVDEYKVPVSITFNSLYYLEEQYEIIGKMIKDLILIGFSKFIIADIGLLLYLKEHDIKCDIHLSGETSEINRFSIDFFNEFNVSRYIFHRKNSIGDMKSCINYNKVKNLEYEAFILNERCHYTGGFCNSLHCDEMTHLCKMPYKMAKINEKSNKFQNINKKFKLYYEKLNEDNLEECDIENEDEIEDSYMIGRTGCGLCSLEKLKKAGVTHLKVVGRGNFINNMEKDVRNLKKAINMIEHIKNSEVFEEKVRDEFFNKKCSKKCYY